MQILWQKFSPLFHILALVFTAGVAWAGVTAQDTRIDSLETRHEALSSAVIDLRTSNARIEQKVDDVKDALNIRHRD